jgi:hypothetical protein
MDTAVDRKSKSREQSRKWRAALIAKGLCYKHNVRPDHIPHCHACQPDKPLRSPKVGEEIKVCLRCAQCGNIYHAGGRYHYHPPRERKYHGIQPGPNNSLFNFDKGEDGKFPAICGACRTEGREEWKPRKPDWGGLCRPHFNQAKRKSGDVFCRHNGATVHLTDRVPEPGQRQRLIRVKFTCGNPDKPTHEGITFKSTALDKGGKPRLEWQGRCSECLSELPGRDKITESREIDKATIDFSREKDDQVPIFHHTCKEEDWMDRERAMQYLYDQPKRGRGLCSKCRNDPVKFAERIAELTRQAESANGGGQEGSEKRTRGGQAGHTRWDRPQFLADLKTVIKKLYKKHGTLSAVTQPAAAFELNLIGHTITGTAVKKRLIECGEARSWDDFVESVVFA